MSMGHRYWDETISLAARCTWEAGSYLADKMKKMSLLNGKEYLLLVLMEKWQDFVLWLKKTNCPRVCIYTFYRVCFC